MKNRRDGKLIKKVDSNHILMPYLKPKRSYSEIYTTYKLDVTEIIKYVEKKRKENPEDKLTYFHVFVAAIAKIIYNRPLLNRFIVNKRCYERNNVSISFVAKQEFSDTSSQVMSVIDIDKKDNINTISKKLSKRIHKIRKNSSKNDPIESLGKLPKFIRDIIMFIFQKMDIYDLLPETIIKNNIYYSSVLVTDIGSLGFNAIYHNLTDFGTNSILVAIGNIHKEKIITKDGKEDIRDICEFGITADERIADGFYFIKSMQELEKIFQNPSILEEDINSVIKDNH